MHNRRRAPLAVRARDGVRRFMTDEAGASMAEYALLIAVVALVAVVGARFLGDALSTGAQYVGQLISSS